MTYGLTDEGLTVPTVTEIQDALKADIWANIDAGQDLGETSPLGQIVGRIALREQRLWELGATCHNQMNPKAAEKRLLDNVCALTGTRRKEPKASIARDVELDLDASTTVPAGSLINNPDIPGVLFSLMADVTSTTAGTYVGDFECTTTGPTAANSGTLINIVSTVSGWNTVTNPLDAELGNNLEEDTDLRIRRKQELPAQGDCTLDSCVAAVEELDGVLAVAGFENVLLTTDDDGLPGKSFEIVVWDDVGMDADDTEIAQAIWDNKPAGMRAYGTTTAQARDSKGRLRDVSFTRATQVPIYFDVFATVDLTSFPADGDDQIKDALVALGDALEMGDDVIALAFRAAGLTVRGVTDVPALELDFGSSPTATANIPVGSRQIATFDTGRITVTHV
jgi:hypothetical protein